MGESTQILNNQLSTCSQQLRASMQEKSYLKVNQAGGMCVLTGAQLSICLSNSLGHPKSPLTPNQQHEKHLCPPLLTRAVITLRCMIPLKQVAVRRF